MPALLISVRFHDGRYHGAGDWPPAPARLFQALVAAAAMPGLDDTKRGALMWLEDLDTPTIAAPTARSGQNVNLFVPTNDLDAKGGDIRRIAETRSATKRIRPRLFDASIPLLYVWHFDGGDSHAKCVCKIVDGLYQLGRGVDMAWATAELLGNGAEVENRLAEYQGVIYRPSENGNGTALDCPETGSLESLEIRHKAGARRFRRVGEGKSVRIEFANPPKPRFCSVTYNSPATRLLFDLRHTTDTGSPFAPWPLKNAAALVQKLRDSAVAKLTQKNLTKYFEAVTVNKVLIGRDATETDKALRVRIVPLPSIGHAQVDRSIRRVLVEVPPDCPIRADDMAWAFTGLVTASHGINVETGEIAADDYSIEELVSAEDDSQLKYYGIGAEAISSRLWRSVTPLALPTARRRVDPTHVKEQAKNGGERQIENRSAIHEVMQALRHVGLRHRAANVRVQREPFDAKGERAETFATGTRFSKHQLWHVEIEFFEAVSGPLVLGNGRYGGLGLMAPVQRTEGVFSFAITNGFAVNAEPLALARGLRRAVMARVQDRLGKRTELPVFFTGHERNGEPARRGHRSHLAYAFDSASQRLLVLAPHLLEHREPSVEECKHIKTLASSLSCLQELRAGTAGKLALAFEAVDFSLDPLFSPSESWYTQTFYRSTRYIKHISAEGAITADVLQELERRHFPEPLSVQVISPSKGARGGLYAHVRLTFKVAVRGPILIGQTSNMGGGLFAVVNEKAAGA